MIKFKVTFKDSFERKLDAVRSLADAGGMQVAAGFPQEKADPKVIFVARAINYRHRPPNVQMLPVNWYPRFPVKHISFEGKPIPAEKYQSWAFMEAAKETIAQKLDIAHYLHRYLSALLLSRKAIPPWDLIGERMAEMIRGSLLRSSAAIGFPFTLAVSTFKRKRTHKVLIESGQMMRSITYAVRSSPPQP